MIVASLNISSLGFVSFLCFTLLVRFFNLSLITMHSKHAEFITFLELSAEIHATSFLNLSKRMQHNTPHAVCTRLSNLILCVPLKIINEL